MSDRTALAPSDATSVAHRGDAVGLLVAATVGSAVMVVWKVVVLALAPTALLLASVVASVGLTAVKARALAGMRAVEGARDADATSTRDARRASGVVIVAALLFLLAAIVGGGEQHRGTVLAEALLLSLVVLIELVGASSGLARDRRRDSPLRHVRLASLAIGIMLLALVQSSLVTATGGAPLSIAGGIGVATAVAALWIGIRMRPVERRRGCSHRRRPSAAALSIREGDRARARSGEPG